MKLQALKDMLSYTQEKAKEVMAIPRARRIHSQAKTKMAELDSQIDAIEGKIEEYCIEEENYKKFDFDKIMDWADELDLLERRKTQLQNILNDLFPEKPAAE